MDILDSPDASSGANSIPESPNFARPGVHRANSSQQRTLPIHSDSDQVKCRCANLALHEYNDRFEQVFAEQMKDHNHEKGYKSVAVLLLTWEANDLEGLKEEVRCLQTSTEIG